MTKLLYKFNFKFFNKAMESITKNICSECKGVIDDFNKPLYEKVLLFNAV